MLNNAHLKYYERKARLRVFKKNALRRIYDTRDQETE
jgi:hypothetical protein